MQEETYPTRPIADVQSAMDMAKAVRDAAELMLGYIETNNAIGAADAWAWISELTALRDADGLSPFMGLMMCALFDDVGAGALVMLQQLDTPGWDERPVGQLRNKLREGIEAMALRTTGLTVDDMERELRRFGGA